MLKTNKIMGVVVGQLLSMLYLFQSVTSVYLSGSTAKQEVKCEITNRHLRLFPVTGGLLGRAIREGEGSLVIKDRYCPHRLDPKPHLFAFLVASSFRLFSSSLSPRRRPCGHLPYLFPSRSPTSLAPNSSYRPLRSRCRDVFEDVDSLARCPCLVRPLDQSISCWID